MSKGLIAASARSGFALGLSAGLVLASAFFLLRGWAGGDDGVAAQAAPSPATASSPQARSDAMQGATAGAMQGATAGSMEAATLELKTRLAARGGADSEWELLAQSYDFLGRPADARLARAHQVSSVGSLQDAVSASVRLLPGMRATGATRPAVQVGAGTSRATTLLTSAEEYRRKREFKQACEAYAAVVALGAMTADSWADYADAQASLAGRLVGAPAQAIDKALALDPQHTKALWLKASLAHEQRHYGEALETWRRLLALVPPGSSDARIVEANIAEARRLAAG
jgi:cytochrome c-type biogenesis protein CcmH/NrfG